MSALLAVLVWKVVAELFLAGVLGYRLDREPWAPLVDVFRVK